MEASDRSTGRGPADLKCICKMYLLQIAKCIWLKQHSAQYEIVEAADRSTGRGTEAADEADGLKCSHCHHCCRNIDLHLNTEIQ